MYKRQEINLRMNMGVVARLIYDNYVCDGVQGRYVIESVSYTHLVSLAIASFIAASIRARSFLSAKVIPKPNSQKSSNNELAQAGP